MSKTPISLLQELSTKQRYVLIYDCVVGKNNGNGSIFKYKVTCNNLSCDGTGTTKKEAKHNAAKNMLSLLSSNKEEVQVSSACTLLAPIANKACETSFAPTTTNSTISSLATLSSTFINYVGILQEICVQRSLPSVMYTVIDEIGPPHMKMFVIEGSIQSLRVEAQARCKKLAKQEAAKLLLEHPLLKDKYDTNKFMGMNNQQQINVNNNNNVDPQEMLESRAQKLGIDLVKCEPVMPIENITKRTEELFIRYTTKNKKTHDYLIKDCHTLFERIYSNKISSDMRERMRMACDEHKDQGDLIQTMMGDIESVLEVNLQEVKVIYKKNYVICLRLTCRPSITQFGIGPTKPKAKTHAMCNIILTILTFLS